MTSATPSHSTPGVLVCFAVKEEAAIFRKVAPEWPQARVLVTGMGRTNADRKFHKALEAYRPELVITCGFAGALDRALKIGDLLMDEDPGLNLVARLQASGVSSAKFHCADRVAVSVQEKATLRAITGADAVEMESHIIRQICHGQGIPSATLRVISDTANEDLPIDFNQLMDADQNLSMTKLVGALISSPGRIPKLMQLQRNTTRAARRLSEALTALLRTL